MTIGKKMANTTTTKHSEVTMSNNKQSSVKIEENWKRIEEVEKLIQEKTGDPEAGFNANLYFFGEYGRHIMLPCKYRKSKKNGEFTDKYFDLDVMVKYCPFTGKPLYEDLLKLNNEQ